MAVSSPPITATVNITIDGQPVQGREGQTILEAAREAGFYIPTLCYHPDLSVRAACRICVVEVKGARTLQAACAYPITEGLVVRTSTPAVREARKVNLELLLSNHDINCPSCARNLNCELQKLARDFNIVEPRFQGERTHHEADHSTPSIVRDPDKCILCRRCVDVCHEVQGVGVIGPSERGFRTIIGTAYEEPLAQQPCVLCGQCINRCPVGALYEVDYTEQVWKALADPKKFVVVQTAPAIRVAIGEEFGIPAGTIVTGQLAAGLRRLGFDRVFDTDFSADLTIIEEGHELLERLTRGGTLPMITSCSPGWIKFIEHYYSDLLAHLSTCKSPQQMFGAVAKTYYAEKAGIDPKDMVVVSIMPCTAKKFECQRPEMDDSGFQDVDYAITTRELARMLRQAGIDLSKLPEEQYDDPLGRSTGAAVIFGATGGVMEAALRTVYEVVTKRNLPSLEFKAVRGMEGIKEAAVDLDGTVVKVAVAHGLANARVLLDKIRDGSADYHFIEIMACPAGCIGGGGQPIPTSPEIRAARMRAIYREDERMVIRKSHENPAIQALYQEFLGQPLGEKSHHLLHTHYTPRGK